MNKIDDWILNSKNTEEQFFVIELFENESYIFERDKRKSKNVIIDFFENNESFSSKNEKENFVVE